MADSALVGVTFIWGSTFVLIKDIITSTTPMLFLSARFGIAALALALIALVTGRLGGLSMRELRWGAFLGVALWAGYALQTIGLQWTTASNGGFITGLYVVLVPVLGVFVLRQMPGRWAWAGVFLATLGLALLSLRLDQGVRFYLGDPLVLGCAVAFGLQVVLVSRVATWSDPLRMALVQVLVAGVLNALSALFFESRAALSGGAWAGALFLGVAATALAIVVQMQVQRFTTAVHAALIFTFEPVFAAVFGVWLQGDHLGWQGLLGAGLILGGMLLAEVGPLVRRTARSRAGKRRTAATYSGQDLHITDVR